MCTTGADVSHHVRQVFTSTVGNFHAESAVTLLYETTAKTANYVQAPCLGINARVCVNVCVCVYVCACVRRLHIEYRSDFVHLMTDIIKVKFFEVNRNKKYAFLV